MLADMIFKYYKRIRSSTIIEMNDTALLNLYIILQYY